MFLPTPGGLKGVFIHLWQLAGAFAFHGLKGLVHTFSGLKGRLPTFRGLKGFFYPPVAVRRHVYPPVQRPSTHLWRFEGVVCGEVDGEEEDAALVRAVRRPHDRRLPVKH